MVCVSVCMGCVRVSVSVCGVCECVCVVCVWCVCVCGVCVRAWFDVKSPCVF